MISAIEVYNDASFRINKENGFFNKDAFNNTSWLAQLNLIDWLTGGMTGLQVPEPYSSNKNKDWLSPFIVLLTKNISDGKLVKPTDYYLFDSFVKLNKKKSVNEFGDIEKSTTANTPIDLLSSDKFDERAGTFIEELKPEVIPIAKMVGGDIIIEPEDVGSVRLQYIRLPKRAKLVMVHDDEFNDEVPDPDNTDDFEWGEYARPLLVWFIVDEFSNHTRENSLKQFNAASNAEFIKK